MQVLSYSMENIASDKKKKKKRKLITFGSLTAPSLLHVAGISGGPRSYNIQYKYRYKKYPRTAALRQDIIVKNK